MTIAEYLEQKGMQKGLERGRNETRSEIARKMLAIGLEPLAVMNATGFIEEVVLLTITRIKTTWSHASIRTKMVRPTGLEPVTYGLEGRCSIQLS